MPRTGQSEITLFDYSDGENGDSSRTVYLFQNGTSSPAVPLNTVGFVASTGVASSTGSWSTTATIPPTGSTIYVASLNLRQPNSTGDWEAVGNWAANPSSSSGANASPTAGESGSYTELDDSSPSSAGKLYIVNTANNGRAISGPWASVVGSNIRFDYNGTGQTNNLYRDSLTRLGISLGQFNIFKDANNWATFQITSMSEDPPRTDYFWAYVDLINSVGNFTRDATYTVSWTPPGSSGSDAPRFAEVKLYTNPAVSSAPLTPSATVTWATGSISGISSGWSRTPPTQLATSSDVIYQSTIVFIDTVGPFISTTTAGSTPTQGVSFSGLVTFSDGDFAIDGGGAITTIDGGNITTGSIKANSLDIDEEIVLSGTNSGFIAGRTSASDFGTDGFYVGKIDTTDFQLSHTSIVTSDTLGESGNLEDGTLQGVLHDGQTGLHIYEPIFHTRVVGSASSSDIVRTSPGTVTLEGGQLHYVTLIGGGGGGMSGGSSQGSFAGGGAGGDTAVTVNSVTTTATGALARPGYTSTNFNADTNSVAQGASGAPTTFGPAGTGGITGNGGDAPSSSYGAGGGGGASNTGSTNPSPLLGGSGGLSGNFKNIVVDLTGLSSRTLTINLVGSGGSGGIGANTNGGSGTGGVVIISNVLSGYTSSTLSEVSAGTLYEFGNSRRAVSTSQQVTTTFSLPSKSSLVSTQISGSTPGYVQVVFSGGFITFGAGLSFYNSNTQAITVNLIQPASNGTIIATTLDVR